MKALLRDGLNRQMDYIDVNGKPVFSNVNASKKYIARTIASDR